MPGTLASLLIKLGLDATGVEQGVARAEKSIGGLSTGAGAAMKVAGTLIGGGLGLAAKGALETEDRAARFQAETGASAEEARHSPTRSMRRSDRAWWRWTTSRPPRRGSAPTSA